MASFPGESTRLVYACLKSTAFSWCPKSSATSGGRGVGDGYEQLYINPHRNLTTPLIRDYTCQTTAAGKYILCKKQTNKISYTYLLLLYLGVVLTSNTPPECSIASSITKIRSFHPTKCDC